MKGLTIAEHWDSYAARVLPPDAPEIQRSQTRLAFYAGASVLLEITERIGEPDISEDQGLAILTALKEEVRAFVVAKLKRDHRRRR